MHQDDFDLTYNPFDDDDDNNDKTHELTGRAQGRQYIGSAFLSNITAPALTRRRSSASESQSSSRSTIRRRHRRSRSDLRLDTDQDDSEEPPPLSGHPLKSAHRRSGDFQDFGITRPHLSRAVQSSSVDSSLFGGSSDTDDGYPTLKEPHTEVLVTTSDSLAGVSLKYGIDLTELRKANQLWPNDSIHLRETLFIPLHRASRAHEYVVRSPSASTTDITLESSGASTHSANSLTHSEPTPPSSTSSTGTNVLRVPVSQLSFFPPSSNRNNLAAGVSSCSPEPPASHPGTPSKSVTHPPRNTTAPNHSLSSFLNVLPIAASTRDEIVSRLSLDSVSSSYSDRTRSRRTSSEYSPGHELYSVTRTAGMPVQRNHQQPDPHPDTQQTPKISQRVNDDQLRGASDPHGSLALGTRQHPGYSRPKLSTSPPLSYVPQVHNPYVRTAQMEPSPGMKVPFLRSNVDGHTDRSLDIKRSPFATPVGNGTQPTTFRATRDVT
ncbi:LysM domain-containing protein [Coprinopsis cinerea okayama7|uniref:LysM domain-containing protein n=1 Tax=Coprinopsis cinerea (strain Okayama-7 / 130 / ATCC MYA-4618 / FGSC 9003) TaxID=240176 RepID=A8N796_COPC7|nr:LysM domain-containing protein [Coprinopsis cinerea okayama7\|eukprot:XP_001830702.1 LysM domain-containing protein [Coprinopsis cinerea okayama7\